MPQASFDLRGRKLFIAIPAYDHKVSMKLAIALAKFARDSEKHGIDIQIGSICGCSVVSRARNLLASDFLESECDTLLFIDSDINFEPEAIYRMLAWTSQKDQNIVATPPRVRDTKLRYITTLCYDDDETTLTMNGQGLVEAERVATAFMAVQRQVFEKLADVNPDLKYFDQKASKELNCFFDFKLDKGEYVGEDFLFCDRARSAGFKVWIDPAVPLGHMGVQEYRGHFGEDVLYPRVASVTPQETDNG